MLLVFQKFNNNNNKRISFPIIRTIFVFVVLISIFLVRQQLSNGVGGVGVGVGVGVGGGNYDASVDAKMDAPTTTTKRKRGRNIVVDNHNNDNNNNNNSSNSSTSTLQKLTSTTINQKTTTTTIPSTTASTTVLSKASSSSSSSFSFSLISTSDDQIPKVPSNSSYAYMFVIGGIHEERSAYKGFLYNVLVAAKLFRYEFHSTTDIWLYIQMAPDSKLSMLPSNEIQYLQALNIHIHVLPKAEHDTFTHLVFSKFRALQMLQYRRVMFIDADIIPLANMDYLFHLSDPQHNDIHDNINTPTILQPNVILASRGEPCNAGVFILQPEQDGWEQIWNIIRRQRNEGAQLPYPHFHWGNGWGYNFRQEHDSWRGTVQKNQNTWKFHAGHSDQGLLYYYVKYFKKHTSIIIKDEIENWIPPPSPSPNDSNNDNDNNKNNKPILLNILYNHTLLQYASKEPLVYQMSCDVEMTTKPMERWAAQCVVPYRDFSHFMGDNKPWELGNPNRFLGMKKSTVKTDGYIAATKLFFDTLHTLNDELQMGIDFNRWHIDHLPQLKNNSIGRMSKYWDLAMDVMKLKNMTEDEYKEWQGMNQNNDNNDKEDEQKPSSTKGITTTTTTTPNPKTQDKPLKLETNRIKVITGHTNYSSSSRIIIPTKHQVKNEQTIAYAISYIKCTGRDDAGMRDAAMVLRHSIHKIHLQSKYNYKMYAIVHRKAVGCSKQLEDWGFNVMVVDPPVLQSEIKGEHLRKKIHRELCCGADEFIKLYAYSLPEQVIVHVDMDFVFLKPMDHLFDAIIYDKDHPQGIAARNAIELETPTNGFPDTIGAFWTRDWPQVAPNKFPAGYQAGFLVARRDPSVVDELVDIIKEGNYTPGWGWNYGWGEKGYGGYVGAMAMQGLLAYYYDYFRTNDAVELNQCRYNHMGMDVRYRAEPNFRRGSPHVGKCRNIQKDECEDCMVTDISLIYSVHYTMCRKPWQCMGTGSPNARGPTGERGTAINTQICHFDHCMELIHKWHDLRTDFEHQLYHLTNDTALILNGSYKPDIFNGHCGGDGNKYYIPIGGAESTMGRSEELYQ